MRLRDHFDGVARRDWDTDPAGTLRIAVVGVGGFARDVSLPAIAAGEYCETAVLVTGSPEANAGVAEEYDARIVDYEAYGGGAASDEYDAVYVATPNALHLPHVETAADLKKDVLCEKPLEATVERAERLVAACEDAGATLLTAYRMQTDPVVRRLGEFVADGGIGDPIRAVGNFSIDLVPRAGPHQWRLDTDLAGGGALMDVGVYPLNTTRFLLDADPVAVVGARTRSDDADGPFDEVEEHVDFGVEFEGARTGAGNDPTGLFSASYSGHRNAELTVLGSEGRLRITSAFGAQIDRHVTVERGGVRQRLDGGGAPEVRELFDYFACRTEAEGPLGPADRLGGRDGLLDVRTADAVYRAAAEGGRLSLDDV
jgi:xylose dehydrogenase (NAD/NADP)